MLAKINRIFKILFIIKDFIYLFLERGERREKERERSIGVWEKHQYVAASHRPPAGDLACIPGMCPDRHSNQQHFGPQASAQPLSHTSQGNFLNFFKGREKERERHINVWEKHWSVASCTLPTGNLAHNPAMCPHQELNQWPFGLWNDTPLTELHQ